MKPYRLHLLSLLLLSLSLAFIQCSGASSGTSSGGSTSSGSTPQLSTIDDLPRASAPVVSSASSSLSLANGGGLFATTGVTLKDMDDSSFDANSSLAMCEAANTLKSSLNEAVQGDLILCYIQNIDFTDAGVDIYDGSPHIFDMNEEGGFEDAFRVKIQITKNSDGLITDFAMHACVEGVQDQYLHQSISGSAFTMRSTYTYNDSYGTGGQDMTVTGTLNGDGDFTSKTISSSYTGDYGTGTYYGSKTVVQGADSATISQADAGTWTWTDGVSTEEGTHANQVYAVAELLNTDTIATIAIGDGAAVGLESGTCCGGLDYDEAYNEGWNGDTTAEDVASDFLGDVAGADLPDFPTEPTITFSGDAAYDCSGDAITLTLDVATIEAACEDLNLGWEWVSCYDIVQNGNGGGNDDGDGDSSNGGAQACTSNDECAQFGEDAICSNAGGGPSICTYACSTDTECAAMADNAICQNGVCTVQ